MKKKTLKKIIVTVGLFAVLTVVLNACGASEAAREAAIRSEDVILDLKLQYQDSDFWDVAEKEAELIEDTIEKKVFLVDFIVSIDGKTSIFETSEARLMYDNDSCRTEVANDLLTELATSEEIVKAHEDGKKVSINGIILRWINKEGFLGHNDICYSVADIDGDGVWNYVSRGKIIYSEEEILSSGDEPLYLHTIDDDAEIVTINSQEDFSFSSLEKLAQPAD